MTKFTHAIGGQYKKITRRGGMKMAKLKLPDAVSDFIKVKDHIIKAFAEMDSNEGELIISQIEEALRSTDSTYTYNTIVFLNAICAASEKRTSLVSMRLNKRSPDLLTRAMELGFRGNPNVR